MAQRSAFHGVSKVSGSQSQKSWTPWTLRGKRTFAQGVRVTVAEVVVTRGFDGMTFEAHFFVSRGRPGASEPAWIWRSALLLRDDSHERSTAWSEVFCAVGAVKLNALITV